MKFSNCVLLLAAVYVCSAQPYDPFSYTERPCGSNLANLWLDVVAVVDNSAGMGEAGLENIAADLLSIFGTDIRIGVNPNEPRTTRLGVVTYNENGTVRADLNKYKNVDYLYNNLTTDILPVSTSGVTVLEAGLVTAELVLRNGRSDGTNRGHYKQVVIIYASSYSSHGKDAPLPVAQRLKSDGVRIITVAYNQKGDAELLDTLSLIATPRFNFTNADETSLIPNIRRSLWESNCFCPNDWIQYRDQFNNALSQPYGSCIQPVNLPANWRGAQISCRSRSSTSHLASEFSSTKHDFILAAVQNTPGFSTPYNYLIGLNFNDAGWTWDQPAGKNQPALTLERWSNWKPNYPTASSSMSAGLNYQSGTGTQWVNHGLYATGSNYVCEMYSCDTENYCDSSDGSFLFS